MVDEIVHGYHVDSNNVETASTFHHDHLRSVTETVDRLGAELSTTEFGPFGGILAETGNKNGNRQRYTGRELDEESGLYYYRARYYDTEVGKFITEDPIGFEAGINFYAYVNNSPIGNNDPTGHICPNCIGGAISAGFEFVDSFFIQDKSFGESSARAAAGFVIGFSTGGLNVAKNVASVVKTVGTKVFGRFSGGISRATGELAAGSAAAATGNFGNQLIGNDFNLASVDFGKVGQAAFVGAVASKIPAVRAGLNPSGLSETTKTVVDSTISGLTSSAISLGQLAIQDKGRFDLTPENPTGASGGFVIYPNKPNTNMMQRVYAK